MNTEREIRDIHQLQRVLWRLLLSQPRVGGAAEEVLAPLIEKHDRVEVALARWKLARGGDTEALRRRQLAELCAELDVYDVRASIMVSLTERECSGSAEAADVAHLHTVDHLWRTMVRRRNRVIEKNMGLVRMAVGRARAPSDLHDDLTHEGVLGLMRAMRRFDPERGVRFSTYVMHSIRSAIRRAEYDSRASVRVPTHVFTTARRIDAAREALERSGDLPGASIELAALRPLRMAQAETTRRVSHVAIDPDHVDDGLDAEAVVDLAQHLALMRRGMGRLDPRERLVLSRRFELDDGPKVTFEDLGRQLGLSREGARLIQQRALNRLRDYIDRPGAAT